MPHTKTTVCIVVVGKLGMKPDDQTHGVGEKKKKNSSGCINVEWPSHDLIDSINSINSIDSINRLRSSVMHKTYHYSGQKIGHLPIKNHPYSILRVPTTQLAKMSIDLKFVELTADVLEN